MAATILVWPAVCGYIGCGCKKQALHFVSVPTTPWYQAPSSLLLIDDTCLTHKGIGLAAPTPYLSAPFEYNLSTRHKSTSLYYLPGHTISLGIDKILSNSVCHSVIRGLCLSLIYQSKTACLGLQTYSDSYGHDLPF